MEQRISLITPGVADVARSRAFYHALGWTTSAEENSDVVFFQAGGMIVALWSRAQLAEDTAVADRPGWGGITLAHNVRSPAEVDEVVAEAAAAGATIARHGMETFSGGYSGVFADPDGHAWEIAHNPFWALASDGRSRLPLDECYVWRATSASASVTPTMASRSATAMCSSGVWISIIPFARFTHERPRALKTFASAPPPLSA